MMFRKLMTFGTLSLYTLSFLALPSTSYAVMNSSTNALNVNANKIKPSDVHCDSFCGSLINGDGQILGLDGSVGWKSSDDQWCADHGSPTEAAVGPKNPAKTTKDCNIPINDGEDCKAANLKLTHCKWHNSQVEPQCMAYMAAEGASNGEKTVLALDALATAACTTACALVWADWAGGGAAQLACSLSGMSASVAELMQTLTQNSSAVSKTLKSLASVASGAGAGFVGAIGGTTDLAAHGTTMTGTSDGGTIQSGGANMSCALAGFYGIMTGLRARSVDSHDKTKDKACEAVKKLASSASVMAPGGQPDVNHKTLSAAPQNNTGGSGALSGGTSAGLMSGTQKVAQNLVCIQSSGISSCMPKQNAATDSQVLSTSGMAPNIAGSPQLEELLTAIKDQASAGDLVKKALNGHGGEIGRGVAQLANEAYQNADEIRALLEAGKGGMVAQATGVTSGAGGGRGGSGGKAAAPQGGGFDFFGGAKAPGGIGGGSSEHSFEKEKKRDLASMSDDIWHTSWNGTIFQLVSEKISQTKDRVDALEWASPLNRAIVGLPNKKPESTRKLGGK